MNQKEDYRTQTGRSLGELTLQAVLDGSVRPEDFRISEETLRRQADGAEAAGYAELAENLRRAAELTHVSNDEVMTIYETLRPGRTSYEELISLAERLETEFEAPRNAALVREAAEVYKDRGIIRTQE
jgi:propanediol dehydratase small subunit